MVVRATCIYDDPRLKMLHLGCTPTQHFQPQVHHFLTLHSLPCITCIMLSSYICSVLTLDKSYLTWKHTDLHIKCSHINHVYKNAVVKWCTYSVSQTALHLPNAPNKPHAVLNMQEWISVLHQNNYTSTSVHHIRGPSINFVAFLCKCQHGKPASYYHYFHFNGHVPDQPKLTNF